MAAAAAVSAALLAGFVVASSLLVADAATMAAGHAAFNASTTNTSLDGTNAILSGLRSLLVDDGFGALGRIGMASPGTFITHSGSMGDMLTRTTAQLLRPKAEPVAPSTPPVLPPASPPTSPSFPTDPERRKSPSKSPQPVPEPAPPSAESSPSPCARAGAPPPPPTRSSAPFPPPPPPPASTSSTPPPPMGPPSGPPPPPPPPPPPGPDGGGEAAPADAPLPTDLRRLVRAFLKAAKAMCKEREGRLKNKRKSSCAGKKQPRCINIYQKCN